MTGPDATGDRGLRAGAYLVAALVHVPLVLGIQSIGGAIAASAPSQSVVRILDVPQVSRTAQPAEAPMRAVPIRDAASARILDASTLGRIAEPMSDGTPLVVASAAETGAIVAQTDVATTVSNAAEIQPLAAALIAAVSAAEASRAEPVAPATQAAVVEASAEIAAASTMEPETLPATPVEPAASVAETVSVPSAAIAAEATILRTAPEIAVVSPTSVASARLAPVAGGGERTRAIEPFSATPDAVRTNPALDAVAVVRTPAAARSAPATVVSAQPNPSPARTVVPLGAARGEAVSPAAVVAAPTAGAITAARTVLAPSQSSGSGSSSPARAVAPRVGVVSPSRPAANVAAPASVAKPAVRVAAPVVAAPVRSASVTPPDDPRSGAGREAAIVNFARGYGGGDCFAALNAQVSQDGFAVSGFSRDEAAWLAFNGALESRVGFRLTSPARRISDAQCATLAFARRQAAYPDFKMRLTLAEDRLRSGGEIRGSLDAAVGRPLMLLLVDDEGRVLDATPILGAPVGGRIAFSTPLTLTAAPVETMQLLVALAGDGIADAPRPTQPVPAERYFADLAQTLGKTGNQLDVAIAAFTID